MKTVCKIASVLFSLAPIAASADTTFTYPKGEPGLSISFPDDWKAKTEENNQTLVVISPDEEIEYNIWALDKASDPKKMIEQLEVTAKSVAADIDEYVDDFEVKESKKGSINGMSAAMFGGEGKSEEGDQVNVEVHYITPDNKRVFVIMFWGSDEAEDEHEEALKKISASIKKS